MIISLFSFGEVIDGPANIRDTINGKLLFSLNDGTEVESTEEKNNWHEIGLIVRIPKTHEGWTIPKDYDLFTLDGTHIGKTISEVDIGMKQDDNAALIMGYTFKGNIKDSSKVEVIIENMLNFKNTLYLADFKNHLSQFDYQDDDQFSWGNTYIYYESWIADPSPGARVRLIFDNKKLIGLIHTREIKLSNYDNYKILWDYKLLTNLSQDDERIDKIINDYIDFLHSVD
tara:strand:- start:123 stop:809 length:687 start_codon:yes stop_codon:yes gene_type:complete